MVSRGKKRCFPRGPELVGRYIEIKWPENNLFYGARVLRYDSEGDFHVVCYDYDHDFGVEHLNLNDPSRVWRCARSDPYQYSLISRIIKIDSDENDSEEEGRLKLACVLTAVESRETGSSRFNRSSCGGRKNVLHKVIWIHGEDMDDDMDYVDFHEHSYSIVH